MDISHNTGLSSRDTALISFCKALFDIRGKIFLIVNLINNRTKFPGSFSGAHFPFSIFPEHGARLPFQLSPLHTGSLQALHDAQASDCGLL